MSTAASAAGTAAAVDPAASHRPYTSEEKRHRIFAIMAASSGNLVEWFDFYVYAFSALYFAPAFFPKSDPTAQLLNTAGVFAAGFLMRPIGGWLFGRVADRYGRRTSMLISVADDVRRLARHRLPAHLRRHRRLGALPAAGLRGCSRACRSAASTAPPPPT